MTHPGETLARTVSHQSAGLGRSPAPQPMQSNEAVSCTASAAPDLCPHDLQPSTRASAISQRRRWWQHARRCLAWAAAHPLRVSEGPDFRTVEVMGAYGIRVEHRTGHLTGLVLVRKAGRLQRQILETPNISLVGSPATVGLLEHIVRRDGRNWAREAGATELDHDSLQVLGQRLCLALWARWSIDGTLQQVRVRVADAFQLDAELVRLARQAARRRGGASAADEYDYNRAIIDRAPLLVLEREAPQLMPLFIELFAAGACSDEPKRAIRTAFLEQVGAPRHWRQFLALPPETLAWARGAPRQPQAGALLDLAFLVARLESPVAPPLDWLRAQLDACGGDTLLVGVMNSTREAALRAHLRAWMDRPAEGKDQLLLEMQIVDDWIDSQGPRAPTLACPWSWWTRRALAWDDRRRQAALDMLVPDREPSTQVEVAEGIELRPLLTPLDLHEEARAMAHCLDRWRDRLAKGSAAAWSVRDRQSGRRIATAGISSSTEWAVQVRGFANRVVSADLEARVRNALDNERCRLLLTLSGQSGSTGAT